MLILISSAKLRVCHQSWYKYEGLLKCSCTASLFVDKGYGKTLENRLKKSRRITLGDLTCLPKTEKRLQFYESAAGNPLDNVKSKQKIAVQGCQALFRIKTTGCLGRGRGEIPTGCISNPLHQEIWQNSGKVDTTCFSTSQWGKFSITYLNKNIPRVSFSQLD